MNGDSESGLRGIWVESEPALELEFELSKEVKTRFSSGQDISINM